MAIKMGGDKPAEPAIQDLYETASASVAAQTLLDAMGPHLERSFELALSNFFKCEPELGSLLDCRAKLKAIYDIKKGLINEMKKGQPAVEAFTKLLMNAA